MTWGHRGSLLLRCRAFSSLSSCRFIPALSPRHPSDHSTPPTPEGSLAPAPGSQVPSMAFATGMQARLPLGPLARGFLTTPQASLDAADWPVAPRPASTPGSRPTPGAALPGTLASPRAGLPPAGCHELVARLRRGAPPFDDPRRPSCWTHIPPESCRGAVAAAYRQGGATCRVPMTPHGPAG